MASHDLKTRLLQYLEDPAYGSLWCWVIIHPPFCRDFHGLQAHTGSVMRLMCTNQGLGQENAMFTFCTKESFHHPTPGDNGTVTLHTGQFSLAWVEAGPDLTSSDTAAASLCGILLELGVVQVPVVGLLAH